MPLARKRAIRRRTGNKGEVGRNPTAVGKSRQNEEHSSQSKGLSRVRSLCKVVEPHFMLKFIRFF